MPTLTPEHWDQMSDKMKANFIHQCAGIGRQYLLAEEHREDGFECLAFHRGKWVHVKWMPGRGWSLGRGKPYICEQDRNFAPLPDNTPDRDNGNGFFDWKN